MLPPPQLLTIVSTTADNPVSRTVLRIGLMRILSVFVSFQNVKGKIPSLSD